MKKKARGFSFFPFTWSRWALPFVNMGTTFRSLPRNNGSSLQILASLGKLQEVKARIERLGEDVNAKDSSGETAWLAAAANGDVQMCTYLVSRGAEIMSKGFGGLTAVHLAAREGHPEIIRILKNIEGFYGPDLDMKTNDGWTALHFAVREKRTSVIHFFISECSRTEAMLEIDLNSRTKDGRTALMLAAENSYLEGANLLLDAGVDAELTCWDQHYAALHFAALAGATDVVKVLLDFGDMVDLPAAGGWTPLMLAASRGHFGTHTHTQYAHTHNIRCDGRNFVSSFFMALAWQHLNSLDSLLLWTHPTK